MPMGRYVKTKGRSCWYSHLKCSNRPLPASEPFGHRSWGNQTRYFKNLQELQLELETLGRKKHELDTIVARAAEWEFPLKDGNVLVLNPAKTTRTGWVGYKLGKIMEVARLVLRLALGANASYIGSNEDERDFGLVSGDVNLPFPDTDEDDADSNGNANADNEREDETSEEEDADDFQDALADLDNMNSEESPNINNVEDVAQPSTTQPLTKHLTAKQQLVADGVKFIDEHLEPDTEDEEERMTYYIVTLTWNPRV